MADQDFQINIKTLADLTGIKLTQAQLEALQTAAKQGNAQAIDALKKLSNAQKEAQANLNIGLTGSTVGIGTLIYMLNFAVNKWAAFNAEQDRWVDGMIKAEEKARELGLSVADMMDAMSEAQRIRTEPLEYSLDRLTYKAGVLKTEMRLAFEAGEYEDAKKIVSQLKLVESEIDRVTSALERQKAAADKAAEKNRQEADSFMVNAVKNASLQVQRTLQQEEAARRTGDEAYLRSAEAFKRGFTPEQAQEYEQLKTGGDQRVIDAINDLKNQLLGIWR